MIIIRLNGGLGNQMFQYASAKAIAERNSMPLILDIDEFKTYDLRNFELDKYDIEASIFSRKEMNSEKILNPQSFPIKVLKKLGLEHWITNYHYERNLLFNSEVLEKDGKVYLEGYFQSEKYFLDIRKTLLKEFKLKTELSQYSQDIKKKILEKSNVVSLHVRRGDYISNSTTHNVHGLCNLEYYNDSIRYLTTKLNSPNIFVFSDDIKWAKENFNFKNIHFIENEVKRIPHEDIYLMSLCDHNIIANSSFSWWGAWLNENQDKIVIAPKKWFADDKMQEQNVDILPETWKRL